jgi:G-protein pathway suppressor
MFPTVSVNISKMKDVVEKMPSVMIERPKMPRATWEALRSHILRERVKKKQELEQNQEVKQQTQTLLL